MIETKKSIVNLPLNRGVSLGQQQQLNQDSAVESVDQPKMSELPSRLKDFQSKLGGERYTLELSSRHLKSVSSQRSMLARISKLSRFQNEGFVQCSDTKSVAELLFLKEDDLVVQNIQSHHKKHAQFFRTALRQSSLMQSVEQSLAWQDSLNQSSISILPRINNPTNKRDLVSTSNLPKLILSPRGNPSSMMLQRQPLTARMS